MRKHERDVFIISKKGIIRKRRSNMISLVLVALFVSSIFLSVVYAAMTTSLKVTGDANVVTKRYYSVVYYDGSYFYEDDLSTPSKQVKINGTAVDKLSEMINLMTDWGTIYMRASYVIPNGETFNPINNVIIKRHNATTTAPADYTGFLMYHYSGTATFNNLNKQIVIDGNASLVPNANSPLLVVGGSGTLNLNGNMKLQNNNTSTALLGYSGNGGAISLSNLDAVVNAEGVLQILDNKAKNGGGIYNVGTLNLSGTVTLSGNTTSDTNPYGGGIYSQSNSKTILSGNVEISNNSSRLSGGGICVSGGPLYIQCKPSGSSAVKSGTVTFTNNTAGSGPNVYANTTSLVYMPSDYSKTGMVFTFPNNVHYIS